MFNVIILPKAKKEIREATEWYNQRENGLGQEFIDEIRDLSKFLANQPESYSIRYDDIRTAVVQRFPFMIHYQIDESKKIVLIVAVLHTKRSPTRWRKRE
jgi:plasmid stabilization system protein ParE